MTNKTKQAQEIAKKVRKYATVVSVALGVFGAVETFRQNRKK